MSTAPLSRVAVYVCTYKRNAELARMLDSLEVAAKHAEPRYQLAVVVVDDNSNREAEHVVEASTRSFPLGLHYRWSGSGNIAKARNIGLIAGMELGDWVAMVDDDQIVVPEWLTELMKVQEDNQADAVTAPVLARFPDDSPGWLTNQPFANLWGTPEKPDGIAVTDLQTANSVIRVDFLKDNPEVRFSDDLGKSGGEDMVFYRAALEAGLKAHYSHKAVNWELESSDRAKYSYQLRRCLWHGNTEAITNLRAGRDSRVRLLARSAKRALKAASHPVQQVKNKEAPQFRYAFAYSLQSVGIVLGVLGVRINHL